MVSQLEICSRIIYTMYFTVYDRNIDTTSNMLTVVLDSAWSFAGGDSVASASRCHHWTTNH